MKKGFISIYTLIVLLVLSLAITFIYEQNQKSLDHTKDLYHKKQAIYEAESTMNEYLDLNFDRIAGIILEDFDKMGKYDYQHYVVTESFKNSKGNEYSISTAYIKRNNEVIDEVDLTDLYLIRFYDSVSVAGSKANCYVYIKVAKNSDDREKNDKSRLNIVLKQSY